jgi:hypothetical protein
MNYQYRYGTTLPVAMKTLYKEGGILRFYRGYLPAIIQGPLSRFGDTASNAGMLALLDATDTTRNLPVVVKTGAASVAAGGFRILLMPVDTVKTMLQVEGAKGTAVLRTKFAANGPKVFFQGALGAAGATMVGHYPWFATYNTLQANIRPAGKDEPVYKLARNALIGFCSSVVSDVTSNSIRVVKTTKQTYPTQISYVDTVKLVVAQDGVQGLFLRGLGTRVLANGMQGMMFSVLWKYLEDALFKKH